MKVIKNLLLKQIIMKTSLNKYNFKIKLNEDRNLNKILNKQ